jgi:hypothetical protein
MSAYKANTQAPWECSGSTCGQANGAVYKAYPYMNTVRHVCMYVCMCTCICVYMYTYTYTHSYTYRHTYIHVHTYIYTYTHTCIQVREYAATQPILALMVHTHTYIHTYTHTCIQVREYAATQPILALMEVFGPLCTTTKAVLALFGVALCTQIYNIWVVWSNVRSSDEMRCVCMRVCAYVWPC